MKLAQARERRELLEQRLNTLGARIKRDFLAGQEIAPLFQEVLSVAQELRDLNTAIHWTEAIVLVSNQSLYFYQSQRQATLNLVKVFEKTEHPDLIVKASELLETAQNLKSSINKIEQQIDLQAPTFLAPAQGAEPKEEA